MRNLRARAIFFWIFAVITVISTAQDDSDHRTVVQADEILEKIERGEPVYYDHKTIEGILNLNNRKLPMADGSPDRIGSYVLSEDLKLVRSPLAFKDCLIMGDIDFSNARILMRASFDRSIILGKANFCGSEFNQSASFNLSQFNHFADFSDSRFEQSAYFKNSFFYENADFSGSQFLQSASFFDSRFNQSAYFVWSQFNRFADFRYSQFDQPAYFSDSKFHQSAEFYRSLFQKETSFDRSYLKSADFNETKFSGDLSFEGTKIDRLNLTRTGFSKVFLRWKSIGHLGYDETAYLLLMGTFKNLNFLEDANDCYYDYRNDRRATLPLLYQPVDYALMLLYGYGVKPDRPIIWSFVFIALFAGLFWWRQGILPVREGEPDEGANRFSLLEAAAFSAMTLLSGGKLVFDPPEYKIAPGRPWRDVQISKALFILERLLGMVLIIMFAIAVGKTIVLGG